MTGRVVHLLEPVKTDMKDRQFFKFRMLGQFRQAPVEEAAIGKPRQSIVAGKVGDLFV